MATAATDFQLATGGGLTAYGVSRATWNDPAAPGAWGLRSTTLLPAPLGLATVTTGLVSSGVTSTFSLTLPGTSAPISVQLITASGSAPLVYEAEREHGSLTMTPLDITTATGLAQLSAALQPGTGLFSGTLTVNTGQNCVFSKGATIEGNVSVTGGMLELSGATVKGHVQVQGGGTVSILQSTLIEGNLQIQDVPAGSAQSEICGATINGNLQYQSNGTAVTIGAGPACAGNTIDGNLQVNGNSAATVISGNAVSGNLQDQGNTAATEVTGNTVQGNLQVQNNTGPSTQVSGNVVSKNLQCENNAAINGSGNSAQKKQDQCAAF